jgi:drug/metabolite transporter (DMT)-like permease
MPFTTAVLALVLVTLIWGTTFAVVKDALTTIPVPLLLALRFSLAALCFAWVRFDRRALRPALILGLLSFAAFASQSIGLTLTGASKAAFITGLNVMFAPLVMALWLGRRPAPRIFLAAAVALFGLGLMTLPGAAGINVGDLWVVGHALVYAIFLVYLGEVAPRYDALALAGMQHVPLAVLAWLWAVPALDALPAVPRTTWLVIVYLAVIAGALVAVLQTYAQRVVPAPLAALVFALEPVFAALFGFLLLGEVLGVVGWIGGGLVVVAMLATELRPSRGPRPAKARRIGD